LYHIQNALFLPKNNKKWAKNIHFLPISI